MPVDKCYFFKMWSNLLLVLILKSTYYSLRPHIAHKKNYNKNDVTLNKSKKKRGEIRK